VDGASLRSVWKDLRQLDGRARSYAGRLLPCLCGPARRRRAQAPEPRLEAWRLARWLEPGAEATTTEALHCSEQNKPIAIIIFVFVHDNNDKNNNKTYDC
jgi:hypothetical protein